MPSLRTELEFEVSTYDIDAANHANNIVYVRWLEDLRCKLFASSCPVCDLLKRNLYPVVTFTQIRYKNPLKLTDSLKGIIWVESIAHGIMNLKYLFQRNDLVIATAEQSCVLMDLQTGKMDKKAMEIYL
ncbi:MAG TPA: acyl-CoA thioesterase [Candidatus Acidoferrales bacterium]|nr:acyl-CoA thioesterase [Candidatus Acidoferrales bacterium]